MDTNLLTIEKTILRELAEQRAKQEAAILEAERQGKELAAERWRSSPEGRKAIEAASKQRAELQKAAERVVRDTLRLAQEANDLQAKMQTNDQAYKTATRTNTFRSLATAKEFKAFHFVAGTLDRIVRQIGLYRR